MVSFVEEKRKHEVEKNKLFTEFVKYRKDSYNLLTNKSEILKAIKDTQNTFNSIDDTMYFLLSLSSFVEKKISEKLNNESAVYVDINIYDESLSVIRLLAIGRFKVGKDIRKVVLYDKNIGSSAIAISEEDFNRKFENIINDIVKTYNHISKEYESKEKKKIVVEKNEKITKIHFYYDEGLLNETLYAITPKTLTNDKLQKIVDKVKENFDKEDFDWCLDDIIDVLEKKHKIKFVPVDDYHDIYI